VKEAGFTVRDFRSWSDYEACIALQQHTWGESFDDIVPINVLRVVQMVGGIAAGAFAADGELLGFVFGITGVENGTPVHWSDMLAVQSRARDRGVGEALKRYQRDALLQRGVSRVYWTFDPLESRNAYINFVRLGVTASKYERDLYGQSHSPLHVGIGTDRLIVTWDLASQRVIRRLQRERDALDAHNVPLVNRPAGEYGISASGPPRLDLDVDYVRIAIPADIQELKTRAVAVAAEWRKHTRAAFEYYLSAGYVVVDFVRGGSTGSYVLTRRPLFS
jgi:chorismate synthase